MGKVIRFPASGIENRLPHNAWQSEAKFKDSRRMITEARYVSKGGGGDLRHGDAGKELVND